MKIIMKKSQLKLMFISMIFFLSFIFLAYAAANNGVILTFPNNQWVLTNSINFNFTANSSVINPTYCAVFVNNSGTLVVRANYTDVTNNTPHVS